MDLPARSRAVGAILFGTMMALSGVAHGAVGRTPGMSGVSESGEAGYSIAIRVPPGANGMTPELSIAYGHRTRNGLLGVGWSLTGLSQISRCARTIAQDGDATPVTLTASDRFCLDGQRLVIVNGLAYGAAGGEYRTEIESFARVRSVAGSSQGPRYFVVEAADGRILEYGATADSRIDSSTLADPAREARVWALNRIRDRNGNAIDFEYLEETAGGGFRIASIRYASNASAGVDAPHRISFSYESRPSNEIDVAWVAGMPIRQIVRLQRVDVQHGSALVRRYELAYEPALSQGGRSRLASLRECGSDGSSCFMPTTIAWQDGTAGFGQASGAPLDAPVSAPAGPSSIWSSMDIDGDGRSDQVWAGGSSIFASRIHYRLAKADGSFGPAVNTGFPSPYGIGTPFDQDGDGRSDLLLMDSGLRWAIVPGTAGGFGTPRATNIALPQGMRGFRGADMNGDGLGDIVWSEAPDPYGNSLKVYVRYGQPGGTFSSQPALLYDQAEYAGYAESEGGEFLGRPGERIDLDGDGAEDLLMNENYSIALISDAGHSPGHFDSTFAGATTFDMNGDGCSEFAYKHQSGRLRIRASGCGVRWDGTEIQGPAWSGSAWLQAHDWNGDGREDLLLYGATNFMVALSTGASLLDIADTGIPHGGALDALAADVNGDGLPDLLARTATGLQQRIRNGPVADLVTSVTDGFGVVAAFRYRPLTDAVIYTRGPDAAHPERTLQPALPAVHEWDRTDGSGTAAVLTTRFRYEGLRQNLHGRGSLGFRRRTVTELSAALPTELDETRLQTYPYTGLVDSTISRLISGPTLSESSVEWSALEIGSGTGMRRLPYPPRATTRLYEPLGGLAGSEIASQVRSIATIDAQSGVITDETVTVTETGTGAHPGASAVLRTTRSGLVNDVPNWCLGRPTAIALTASHSLPGGDAITRNFSIQWDGARCRPASYERDPQSASTRVTVALGYDAFGNVASRAASASGVLTRTTAMQWDVQGRSPSTVSNPLGHPYRFVADPATGLPLALTDPNDLTTRWSYDTFGRLETESRPDGTTTAWNRAACQSACDERTRYQLTERRRDAAGIEHTLTVLDFDRHDRAFRIANLQPGGGMAVQMLEFDALGRKSRAHAPRWSTDSSPGYWRFDYDSVGRPSAITLRSATGAVAREYLLRHAGLAVTHVDALGRTTVGTTTAWGAPVDIVDPAGGRTSYQYDAFGSLLRAWDPGGALVAEVAYDGRGLPIEQTEPNSGTWRYAYNPFGELVSMLDAKGQSFGYTYDKLGRLTDRTSPDGASKWTWGSSATKRQIGGISKITGPGYAESFLYDAYGRLATHTITTDAAYRYDYAYDSMGQPATLTYPSTGVGGRFKLGYAHEAGRLVRLFNAAKPSTVYWSLAAADAAGRVVDESLGNSIRVVSGYDPLAGSMDYRLVTAGGSTLSDRAYTWDAADNLSRRQDPAGGTLEDFRYDGLDRMTDAIRDGANVLHVDYDATGNLRGRSDVCAAGTACFTYDGVRRHAVTSAGGLNYDYDANGNMIARGAGTIAWDADNRPVSISDAAGNSSQFSYGPMGERWRQLASYGGIAETTVYAGSLLQKVQRDGTTTWRHYIPSPTGLAALHRRFSNGAAATTHYLAEDHLGGTELILDSAGRVALDAAYAPFGARTGAGGSGSPTTQDQAAIASLTRIGFTGHEHLDNLGLIHMGGRVYDPRIGRFLSADPFVASPFDSQSLNRYAYVWNNPLSLVDPDGYNPKPPACVESSPGVCAHITVVGVTWSDVLRASFGAGARQVASALERDPCGQEGSAYFCATDQWRFVSPSSIVLTAGTRPDPTLDFNPGNDKLQGFAARLGNLAIGASPVVWLFGADPDFEWFDVPDTERGRAGATLGNVGYVAGGLSGIIRKGAVETGRNAPVVIGENMARVKAFAMDVGGDYFQGRGMAANRAWIQAARDAGRKIIDIGPDFERRLTRFMNSQRPESLYYSMERSVTWGYENLQIVWQRSGRFWGEL